MRIKLFWQLALTYLLLPLLVLLLVDFLAGRIVRSDREEVGFAQLEAVLRVAETHLPPSREDWQNWAMQWSRSGARVTVIASAGTVIADSQRAPEQLENHAGRPEVRAAMAAGSGRAIRHSDSIDRDLLYLAQRIEWQGEGMVVRFAMPLRDVEAAVAAVRRRLWTASLPVLALAIAGALLLSRRVSRRVEGLTQFARRVAEGNFTAVPAEHAGDEISELTRAMNQTAARLAATIASLEREKDQSATILRSMVEGVVAVSAEGRILFLNDSFRRAVGAEADPSEGRALVEVVRQSDLIKLVQRAQENQSQADAEVALSVGGTTRHFAATAVPVATEAGKGVVMVLHDITELRRLERVRRDFVANVSHEFKTPLTAIQGFAETLLGGALEDRENNRRFIEIIREHAARLARLTDDLLTLSRIEAGKLELNLQPVSVADLVEACLETTQFRARQKNLHVTAEIRENLPPLMGDMRRLSEVLQNLVDNAVQYTNPGGRIALHADVTPDGREIVLSVHDTGIGIPQHEQLRIFERFYRVDAARSREAGGTGLGLSIARHLAEAHGGRIEVKSEAGEGSTFSFYAPIARSTERSKPSPHT